MGIVVDVVSPVESSGVVQGNATVVSVVNTTQTPVTTQTTTAATVSVVHPGGTVANVQWGYQFPSSPTEGQIFIKLEP